MKSGSTSKKGDRSSTSGPLAASDVPLANPLGSASLGAAVASPDGVASSASAFSFGSKIERCPVGEYRLGEEIANAVSHGVGALLSVAALVICIVWAARGGGGGVHVLSALVFGITMLVEYVVSTLYHALTAPRAKQVFKVLDHACIYLFIAGSYTPFCLISLSGHGGWALCIFVWLVAIAGVVSEVVVKSRPRWLAALIYVLMGWAVVWFLPALYACVPPTCFYLIVAGGLCYTAGCVFYVLKKVPYFHFIFHLFVLAGSILHFLAVLHVL